MNLRDIISFPKDKSHTSFSMLQTKLAEMMDNFFEHSCGRFPAINVVDADKTIEVQAELPSMTEKDVKINFNRNNLIISGDKSSEVERDKDAYHMREISYGHFSRSINLPFDIDPAKVKAKFSKGMLTVTIQKPDEEAAAGQSIPISSE